MKSDRTSPECTRPYPPLTHFSHLLWIFYLICLLQTTQTNLVQNAHGHAYSNSIQRQVKGWGETSDTHMCVMREVKAHSCAASISGYGRCGRPYIVVVKQWKQSTPHLSFNSSPFPVTMATYLFLLPNYSVFPPLLSLIHLASLQHTLHQIVSLSGELLSYLMKMWCSETWFILSFKSHDIS